MGEHRLHLFRAIVHPLVTVIVGIGIERRGHNADGLDAPEQVVVDQGAVLDPVARIRTGVTGQDALVRGQDAVDGHVAVGVDADPEVMVISVLHGRINILLAHGQDSEIIGPSGVGRAHAHGPFGGRSVRGVLHRADAQHVVAEARAHARGLQGRVDLRAAPAQSRTGHEGQAEVHLPRGQCILVGDEALACAVGIGGRGQTRRRHFCGSQGDGVTEHLARDLRPAPGV
jgi:hypothetical protein